MAAPTVKAVGTSAAAASGNVTPTMPANASGDLLLVFVCTRDNVALSVSGYTVVDGYPYQPASDSQLSAFYKSSGGSEGNPTVTHTAGDGILANCIVIDTGTWNTADVVGGFGSTNTTLTVPSITPEVVDTLHFVHVGVRNDTSDVAAMSCGGLTWTERFDDETNLGASDNTNSVWTAPDTTTSATGAGSFTTGVSTSFCVQWALRPAAGGTTYTKTNIGILGLTGSGADAMTFVETGAGIMPLTGSGADFITFVETGMAVLGLTGSGTSQVGGGVTYTKDGAAILGLTASGTKVVTYTEAGMAVLGLTGSGVREGGTVSAAVVYDAQRDQFVVIYYYNQ